MHKVLVSLVQLMGCKEGRREKKNHLSSRRREKYHFPVPVFLNNRCKITDSLNQMSVLLRPGPVNVYPCI